MTNATAPNPELLGLTRRGTPENLPVNEKEHIPSALERGKEKVKLYEKRFEGYVSEHPVKSVLFAVGTGLAIGWLLGRKR